MYDEEIKSYPICYETGKKCYTREEAGRYLNNFKRSGRTHKRFSSRTKTGKIPKRCYYCKECQMWHLTSLNSFKTKK